MFSKLFFLSYKVLSQKYILSTVDDISKPTFKINYYFDQSRHSQARICIKKLK